MALALTCTVFVSRVVGTEWLVIFQLFMFWITLGGTYSQLGNHFLPRGPRNTTHLKTTMDFVVELPGEYSGGQFYVSVKCKGGNSVGNRLIWYHQINQLHWLPKKFGLYTLPETIIIAPETLGLESMNFLLVPSALWQTRPERLANLMEGILHTLGPGPRGSLRLSLLTWKTLLLLGLVLGS